MFKLTGYMSIAPAPARLSRGFISTRNIFQEYIPGIYSIANYENMMHDL